MHLTGLDHLVLCVADVEKTVAFYSELLGMQPREERPGKWSLHFGPHKISLQDARANPEIAADTIPGTGNFCVLTDEPVAELADKLRGAGIEITATGERDGATGKIDSIYFRDPDGNLVEVSNRL
jgi:catechol 2,3-dioxygenase-like lactoylglutathione lyase family enzyme